MSNAHAAADSLRYSSNVVRTAWSLRWLWGQRQHRFLKEMGDIWGDRFRFPLGLRICTVMSHPEAVRQIFENHAGSLSATASRRMVGGVLPPKSLPYQSGENAHVARKVTAAAFADTIAEFDDQPLISELVSRLRAGSDLAPMFEQFSNRLAIGFLVGHAEPVLEDRLAMTLRSVTGMSPIALGIPWLRKLPPHRRKFATFSQSKMDFLTAIKDAQTDRRFASQSMMSQLEHRGVEHGISTTECRHNLAMFVGAIAYNLRIVITNSLKHLADHPCWQKKLRMKLPINPLTNPPLEFESSTPSRDQSPKDAARITKAIVQESLRLRPPVPLISRYVQADTQIDGTRLKQGQLLFISPWLAHFREESFSAPSEFRPERFLGAQKYENSFIPFGGGRRHCLGAGFTYGTVGRVLVELVKYFQIDRLVHASNAPSHRMAGFNMVPATIPVRLTSLPHRVETEAVHA